MAGDLTNVTCQEEANSRWSLHNSQVDPRSNMTIVGPPLPMAHSEPGIGPQYHNDRISLKSIMCEGSNLKLPNPPPSKQLENFPRRYRQI